MKQRNPQILATSPLALVATTLVASCLFLSGNPAQAQSSISGIYPDGIYQFEPSPTLTFHASSPAGVPAANVTVALTITSLQTGQSFIRNLTSTGGLTISGPATNLSVSALLNSNTIYSAVISVTDAASSTASTTVSFDTINAYTWEAEDYDYTSNSIGGLFIDGPQTNLYRGLGATLGVDCAHTPGGGGGAYRPYNGSTGVANTPTSGLETEGAGDKPRIQYSTGQSDYDIGFNNGGDFANYTRHYPPGVYNVYLRGSGGNGPQADAASMTVQSGTAVLAGTGSGTAPFQFSILGGGWQTYAYCPLKDSAGNLAQISLDGSQSTLRVTIDGGNCNEGFYMLVPVDTNISVSTASISNVIPDGTALYQSSNTLTFNVGAPDGVSPGDIIVVIGATNLFGQGFTTNLTSANGLTITGPSTNLSVSTSLTTNTVYSVFIQAFDAHGVPTSTNLVIDTVVPFYSIEAEDFDYGGGNYFDNPQVDAYDGFDGIVEVDFHGTQNGGSYNRVGLTTEPAHDKTRAQYSSTNLIDYDVGFNNGGNWGNYTRHYPAGTFNIFVRASDGGASGSSDSGSMSLVTGGLGTTSQTVVKLGTWGVPVTGNWQTYVYVPVKDPAGNLVQFSGGALETLRMTIDNGNCNENFFLFNPADTNVVLQPYVDNFTPDGSSLFQPSNTLSFIVHSQPGTATNNIVLSLNGTIVSGLTFSGTPNFRTVTYPVALDGYYTAIVTATDAHGSISVTNIFGTFNSTDYQLEAEDYDYGGGSFYDNPQVDSYNGLGSVANIDNHQSDLGANPFDYRANSAQNPAPATTPAGDLPRSQFASGTDYNIGFFGPNSWANYTRHYPSGTYGVMARVAEGNAPTEDTLYMVTSGVGTTNQTTSTLGTFHIPLSGWSNWKWTPLDDNNGNQARVVFPSGGGTATLRLGGSLLGNNEANVNFMMLVKMTPSPELTAAVATGHNVISFPTETGYSYQVEYKNHLSDPTWTNLGGSVSGDNTTHSVTDPALTSANGTRFYRVQVQ